MACAERVTIKVGNQTYSLDPGRTLIGTPARDAQRALMLVSRSYRICSANGRTADGTGLRFLYDQVSGRWLFTATGPSTPNASVSPTTIPVEVRIGDDWGTTNLKFTKTFGIWIGRPS